MFWKISLTLILLIFLGVGCETIPANSIESTGAVLEIPNPVNSETNDTLVEEKINALNNEIINLKSRITILESKPQQKPVVIYEESSSDSDFDISYASLVGNDDFDGLNSEIESLNDRFEEHQSCLRLWSIGNDFMPADDIYHCSNK